MIFNSCFKIKKKDLFNETRYIVMRILEKTNIADYKEVKDADIHTLISRDKSCL
jgi:hypothetical protein